MTDVERLEARVRELEMQGEVIAVKPEYTKQLEQERDHFKTQFANFMYRVNEYLIKANAECGRLRGLLAEAFEYMDWNASFDNLQDREEYRDLITRISEQGTNGEINKPEEQSNIGDHA